MRIAPILIGVVLLAACGLSTRPAASTPTPTLPPTATPTPTHPAAPTPTSAPTATPTALPEGFICSDTSGGSETLGSRAITASATSLDGSDRFVIQFDGTVPGYSIRRQVGTTFTLSPSGRTVTLAGTNGLLVLIKPVQDWTSYSGPDSLKPGLKRLREAQLVENFEGVQQWALGIAGDPCYRVSTSGLPPALVIDIASR